MNILILKASLVKLATCVNYNISFLNDNQPDNYIKIVEDQKLLIVNSPTLNGMNELIRDNLVEPKNEEISFKLDFSLESFLTLSKLFKEKPIENEITIELFIEILKLADFLGYDDFKGIERILTDVISKYGNERIYSTTFEQKLSLELEKTMIRKIVGMKLESLGLNAPNYFQETFPVRLDGFKAILIPLCDETTVRQITIDENLMKKLNRSNCLEYLDLFLQHEGIKSIILTGFNLKFLSSPYKHGSQIFENLSYDDPSNIRFDCFDYLSYILGLIDRFNITHLQIVDSYLTDRHYELISNLTGLKYFDLGMDVYIPYNGYSKFDLYTSVLNNCSIESISWLDVFFNEDYKMIITPFKENSENLKTLQLTGSTRLSFEKEILSHSEFNFQQIFLYGMTIKIEDLVNCGRSLKSLKCLKLIYCGFIMPENFQNDICLPNIKELSLIGSIWFLIEKYEFIVKLFPNLEKLEIIGDRLEFSIEDIEMLKSLPLKEINISCNELRAADISKINLFESLEILNIEYCKLNAGQFTPLKNNKNLKILRAGNNNDFGKADLEALLEIKTLEYLSISSISLSPEIVKNAILKRENLIVILNNQKIDKESSIN